jgi:hypothetical protein
MTGGRCIAVVSCVLAATVLPQGLARAVELHADLPVLGQVRQGYLSNGTEAPIELFGDLGLSGLRHGTTLDTYFRLQEDFAQLEGETDFYSGVLRVPAAIPGLDAQLGRQIVSNAPTTIFDADAGQVGFTPDGSPVAFNVFGGAPRYFEPTTGVPEYSENQQIFGGNLRTTQLTNGAVSLGYLQQFVAGRELKQLVNATGTRSFLRWPGMPNLYGSFAYDADHQNIDQVRAGMQGYAWDPHLLVNFESSYYKPQDNGKVLIPNLNRREDPIFQVFSLSQELQFRGGTRYQITKTASAFADFSYQRYEELATAQTNAPVNGYVWSAGMLFLPGGDGLEVLNLMYYGADEGATNGGGFVDGIHASYENRVYDRILFRANADVAYYQKITNQDDTAVASLIGLDYILLPGLVAEVNFEANRNQLFNEDFRFGFFITYNARYQTAVTPGGGIQRTTPADQWRPWPWGLAEFGPASWTPKAAAWNAVPVWDQYSALGRSR